MKALVLLALLPAAAQAETLDETHFRLNFCYESTLDSAYIAAHPDLPVRRITLRREPLGTKEVLGSQAMEVEVVLRAGGEIEELGRCQPDGDGLTCTLGRDAGRFGIEAQGNGLLLTVGTEGMVFRRMGDEARLEFGEGEEAAAFLLRRCG